MFGEMWKKRDGDDSSGMDCAVETYLHVDCGEYGLHDC